MKNNEILLDVIGDTDEKLIPELSAESKRKRIIKWSVFGGSICAVAVIVCAVMLSSGEKQMSYKSLYGNLPHTAQFGTKSGSEKIESEIMYGDMGFEGLMAYDISELDVPNPCSPEDVPQALPVYRNLSYETDYLTSDTVKEIAENTAAALDKTITGNESEYEFKCDDSTSIKVYGNGMIGIFFGKAVAVPPEYKFTHGETSPAEAEKILSYFSEQYAELLQYDEPVCYSFADRSYSGEEIRSYYVYNKSEDTVSDILNFSFYDARFCPDDSGDLMCIWLTNSYCSSEYAGDYPVITADEAAELLLSGSYYSSVPADYLSGGTISAEDIARTDLIYRTGREKYYQPYYRFYVELDSEALNMADNLKNFGIFYVPAIESEYLSDFSPGVSFN
ncbi:MAG: hypothetical protein PUB66_05755 [Oscillospiraceae bacterium]|nr:hypothetical protein [Ruminococcus sp.]MDD6098215.1 hypothetical protein [Oscillospiraceae bacterium]